MIEIPVRAIREDHPGDVSFSGVRAGLVSVPIPESSPGGLNLYEELRHSIQLNGKVNILSLDIRLVRNFGHPVIPEHIRQHLNNALHGVRFVKVLVFCLYQIRQHFSQSRAYRRRSKICSHVRVPPNGDRLCCVPNSCRIPACATVSIHRFSPVCGLVSSDERDGRKPCFIPPGNSSLQTLTPKVLKIDAANFSVPRLSDFPPKRDFFPARGPQPAR